MIFQLPKVIDNPLFFDVNNIKTMGIIIYEMPTRKREAGVTLEKETG